MTIPKRKQLRLPTYDYTKNGLYFITICIQNKKPLLGHIKEHIMLKSDAGQMIESIWYQLENKYNSLTLHEFVVMPNHIHGIIEFYNSTIPIPTIIQNFKSLTTNRYIKQVHQNRWKPFNKRLWQRNYYEHIIRNDASLHTIQKYIINNPIKWKEDSLYI